MTAGKIDQNALDLSNVSGTVKPLPANWYDCFMKEAEITEIANGDNAGRPMIKIQWVPDPDVHPAFRKRILFDNVPVIPPDSNGEGGTLWRVKQLSDALGFTDVDYKAVDAKGNKIPFRIERIVEKVGTKVRLQVGIRTYQGDEQNNIKKYKRPDGDLVQTQVTAAAAGMPDF